MQATLRVLYERQPTAPGEHFVQARAWETDTGDYADVLLEVGSITSDGELVTTTTIMPCYAELSDVLAALPTVAPALMARQPAAVAAD